MYRLYPGMFVVTGPRRAVSGSVAHNVERPPEEREVACSSRPDPPLPSPVAHRTRAADYESACSAFNSRQGFQLAPVAQRTQSGGLLPHGSVVRVHPGAPTSHARSSADREQPRPKRMVGGSTPPGRPSRKPRKLTASDRSCKATGRVQFPRGAPGCDRFTGTVAKMARLLTLNQGDAGSTPARSTKYMRDYMRARHHDRRARVVAYLGGRCVLCGTTDNLEIDHIDPAARRYRVHRMLILSEEKMWAEVEKCQLLCGRHHDEKTMREKGHRPAGEYGHGTHAMYRYCKCDQCREFMSAYNRERKKIRQSIRP